MLTRPTFTAFLVCGFKRHILISGTLSFSSNSNVLEKYCYRKDWYFCRVISFLAILIVFMKNHFLWCNICSFLLFFPIIYLEVKCVEVNFPILCYIEKYVSWTSLFWEYIACLTWINSEESVGTAVVLPSEVGYLLPVLFQQGVEFLRPLDPIQNYGRCRGDNRWKVIKNNHTVQ